MTDKPSRWLDLLLAAWIAIVGVVYFGGYFVPAIGVLTPNASVIYAFMVLVSVLILTMRYLRRDEKDIKKLDTKHQDTRTKNRK